MLAGLRRCSHRVVTRRFLLGSSLNTKAARPQAAMSDVTVRPEARRVLDFWLGEGWAVAPPEYMPPDDKKKIWFFGGPAVDKEITELFAADCEALAQGAYDDWQASLYDCLAGILVGDQLSRNVWRGSARMFSNDVRVLAWAKALVASGQHTKLRPIERVWNYMPYMHSEALEDQEECVRLFEALVQDCQRLGAEAVARMASENVRFAILHRDVVARWGRFPHRNALLGRPSTAAEEAGLADGSIAKF